MRKISIALALIGGLLALPAHADFTGKDASAATITFKNPNVCTSVACVPIFQMTDGAGVALGVVGSPLFIGFGTGVTLPAYAATPTFNLGTLNGAATAANQGNTTDAPCTLPASATACSHTSVLKAIANAVNGTATAANQATGNTSVSSIDTKTPSLVSNAGSAVATGSSNVPGIAYLYGFNGTTWDQLQVDASKFLKVNCATGCAGGTFNNNADAVATSATNGQAAAWGYVFNGTTWDRLRGDTTNGAWVNVKNANANGRAVSGSSSPVVPTPALSTWHLIAAATTNATSVKGSAATVFSCQLGGIAGPAFLKIYNKATAPTVGTDTPVKTLIIPVASTAANGAGSNISFGPGGLTLATGFAAAVTGVITDADTTAVAAASFAINCDYE